MNTDGSFECSCSTEGYQLSGDGLTCQGMYSTSHKKVSRCTVSTTVRSTVSTTVHSTVSTYVRYASKKKCPVKSMVVTVKLAALREQLPSVFIDPCLYYRCTSY